MSGATLDEFGARLSGVIAASNGGIMALYPYPENHIPSHVWLDDAGESADSAWAGHIVSRRPPVIAARPPRANWHICGACACRGDGLCRGSARSDWAERDGSEAVCSELPARSS